jgi:asparagine synthase (glutamine-hydrolysing)
MFKGVRKILPGHLLEVQRDSRTIRTSRYWEPSFEVDRHHTEAYFAEELRRLLQDAARLQMRSDVPLGCSLSGGFDSSLVTTLAAPLAQGRLKTFSGAFVEGREFNELEYSRALAQSVGAERIEIFPSQTDFVDFLPSLVYHMDEPAGGPGLFPQYMVARRASRQVKVMLGGQGGDEIFGGYARYLVAYFEQALKGAIFETNEEDEHLVSLRSIVPNLPALQQYAPMMQHFFRTELFEPMDLRYFRLLDRSAGALECLTGDRAAAFDKEAIFARFQQSFNHPNTASYYNKMTHFDLTAGLPALLQVEDRASMATSLESRVPLLDHRIVQLVSSMPPGMKFKGGELKYILKRAVQHLLPAKIARRKDKMGFPVPLHLWSRGRCRDLFADVLLSGSARDRGLFDLSRVEFALRDERAFSRRLWGMINLELWYRTFIDGTDQPISLRTLSAAHAR